MALESVPEWVELLSSIGIPNDESKVYATEFVKSRLSRTDLQDLDKETLHSLNVTILGDQLKILRLGKESVSSTTTIMEADSSTSGKTSYKCPSASASVKLPCITTSMTQPAFRKVKIDWEVYKTITSIPDRDLTAHLYSACEPSLQSSLINAKASFLQLNEEEALNQIEAIVTKSANPAVHRKDFHSIVQGEIETVQDFVIRLQTAVPDCEFSCPSCDFDLSDTNIRDQFIRGLSNTTIQTDVLTKASQLSSLEEVVNHAKSIESALRDQSSFEKGKEEHVYGANYRKSNLKKSVRFNTKTQSRQHARQKQNSCIGCGSETHRNHERDQKCPAWGQICSNCGKDNHYAHVCFRESSNVQSIDLIGHVKYDKTSNKYTSASPNIEQIDATLTPKFENKGNRSVSTSIFPDSGASICLGGPDHLEILNVPQKDLIPCKKGISAVGGSRLHCLGWLPVEFTVQGHKTTQPLFICENVDRIYFSKEACLAVTILPPSFPNPMYSRQDTSQVSGITKESLPRTNPPEKPNKIPYAPTPENIPKLKKYLLDKFATSTFNKSAPFPSMKTTPAHIHLKPDAVPYARHSPIPIPRHWKASVKKSLDEDVKRGVIKPVEVNTPVEWCSPMVVTTKKDGSPRRTIDLQKLNSQSLRETHHCQSPFHLASQVPSNTYKTVIDAVDGYHAIPLDEESQKLTTFITEWGRYQYLRMPQGFKAAGDVYTRRYDELIEHIPNKVKIVDDVLLHTVDIENNFWQTWDFLTLLANNGITANATKLQFCCEIAEFAGLTVTMEGVRPSETILSAIKDFPTPTNLTSARSWFGLVNQVSWAYAISPLMQPFRDLLKPKVKFFWDTTLENLFQQSKDKIIAAVEDGIRSFDPQCITCLQTDWSEDGVGYLLLQKHCECSLEKVPTCCPDGWKLIYAGSRFTNPAESNYSPTEGEALAVTWSLANSRMFTVGCPNLIISVDHQPLLGILNDRDLSSIKNPRLLSLKEDTFAWQFKITYNPGRWHRGPDAVSRNPVGEEKLFISKIFFDKQDQSPLDIKQELAYDTLLVASLNEVSNGMITRDQLAEACNEDENYQKLISVIRSGFPSKRQDLLHTLREFWEVRDRLSHCNGVVYMDQRFVVPLKLRKLILESLHAAHQGVSGMKARANISVYWPNMSSSVTNARLNCRKCTEIAPSQVNEPLITTSFPEWPFQLIAADYFFIDLHSYLVIADRYSGWLIIYYFKPGEANHSTLINIFRNVFANFGVPEELSSDGGSQFIAHEFNKFLNNWDVRHRTSSAEYPQSNGRAESAVKSAKRIVYDNANPDGSLNNNAAARALLQYRNTPLKDCKLSPAQILFHRQLRDTIPSHPTNYHLHPEWLSLAKEREEKYRRNNHAIANEYNRHTKELPPLAVGSTVIIQSKNGKWLKQGKIVEYLDNRQYRVKLFGSNRVTLRNRKFIKLCAFSNPSLLIISTNPNSGNNSEPPTTLPVTPNEFHDI